MTPGANATDTTKNVIKSAVILIVTQRRRKQPDNEKLDPELQESFSDMYNNHQVWKIDKRLELILSFIKRTNFPYDDLLAFQLNNIQQTQSYIRKICEYDDDELTRKKAQPDLLNEILEERLTDRRLRILSNYLSISSCLDKLIKIEEEKQSLKREPKADTVVKDIEPVAEKKLPAFPFKLFSIATICLLFVFSVVYVVVSNPDSIRYFNQNTSDQAYVTNINKKTIIDPHNHPSQLKENQSEPLLHEITRPPQEKKKIIPTPPQHEIIPRQTPKIIPTPRSKEPELEREKLDSGIKTLKRLPLNLIRGNPNIKEIALTFDGGSEAHDTEKILAILDQYQIKTTFFLTGQFIELNPEMVKKIVAHGHEVGNHLYSHPHPKSLSDEQFRNELRKTDEVYYNLISEHMVPYWRAPYGEYYPHQAKLAREMGYYHIHWTHWKSRQHSLDTIDWVEDPESHLYYTSEQIKKHILTSKYKSGGIVLLHVGAREIDPPYRVFPDIIKGLRDQGYQIVTITQMIEDLYR